jgi:hypothetical protein
LVDTFKRSVAVNDGAIAAEAAATSAGGGQYADITELFCTAQRCPVIVGDDLVYRDDNHVTVEYAQALAPVIAALTDRALAPAYTARYWRRTHPKSPLSQFGMVELRPPARSSRNRRRKSPGLGVAAHHFDR